MTTESNELQRTRLGSLLVERQLISEDQLNRAIAEQKQSRKQLGQILVEQNLVSGRQLRSLLRLQRRLRATVLTSVLSMTPLILTGCGGGAAASSTVQRSADSAGPATEQVIDQEIPQYDTGRLEIEAPSTDRVTSPDLNPVSGSTETVIGTPPETSESAPAEETQAPVSDLEISLPPADQTATAGTQVTLNVSASSSETLTYQWYRNNQPITGAILPTLTLSPVTMGDAASYHVVVSDGITSLTSDSAQLQVVVDQEAQLNWLPPSVREDGSPLDAADIRGYRVYHSTEDGSVEVTYDLDASTSELELRELVPGVHYFAVTTVDINGLESNLSNMLSKTIY